MKKKTREREKERKSERERGEGRESQTERVGERRQYDCVNYVERCKGNKTKRSTPRPSHPTSVVVCGSGVVT